MIKFIQYDGSNKSDLKDKTVGAIVNKLRITESTDRGERYVVQITIELTDGTQIEIAPSLSRASGYSCLRIEAN